MKKIYLIGIGPGDPEYLTIKAINTMKKVDVFFLLEKKGKGEDRDLIKIRKEILGKYLNEGTYRIVTATMPVRKRGKSYEDEVKRWRQQKAEIITSLIKDKMKDGENGAFLVWGDPSLYDGNLEILQNILKNGLVNFDYETVAGITSIQILAERHKIPLNRIGETITITTGRRLESCPSSKVRNTVVLLDSYSAFSRLSDQDIDIYWGGYLGTDDEILLSGKLKDIIDDLQKTRKEAKKKKGWIMDTYILRQTEEPESDE